MKIISEGRNSNKKDRFDVNLLQGIGSEQIRILKKSGIKSLVQIVKEGPVRLSEITGIDTSRASTICSKARNTLAGIGYTTPLIQTAHDAAKYITIDRISTGCNALDNILGGGIETHAITEFVGESGSGKTQVCHTIAVTAQLEPKETIRSCSTVIYVDTEGTFRSKRIAQIASERGANSEVILKNILLASVYNTAELGFLVDNLETIINDNGIKLIIVDSLISPFRAEYKQLSKLPERQKALHKTMIALLTLARLYGIGVVVTNHIQDVPTLWNSRTLLHGVQAIPTGGHVMAHDSTYRILLRKTGLWSESALIFSSPYHPTGQIQFKITDRGIDDGKEYY
jgi:DNA repair protein RadA